MNNSGLIKLAIVILAVICIGLFIGYTASKLSPAEETKTESGEVANYGMTVDSQNGTDDSNSYYTSDDNNTVEMDEIPNDAGEYVVSDSSLEG